METEYHCILCSTKLEKDISLFCPNKDCVLFCEGLSDRIAAALDAKRKEIAEFGTEQMFNTIEALQLRNLTFAELEEIKGIAQGFSHGMEPVVPMDDQCPRCGCVTPPVQVNIEIPGQGYNPAWQKYCPMCDRYYVKPRNL